MSSTSQTGHAARRARYDVDEELMDAADAIADMAQRVQLNGPEPTYASEKLGHALYKAAEGLALCGVELDEVTEEARRGHEHGMWSRRSAMTLAGVKAGDIVLCRPQGPTVLRDRRRAPRARARGRPDRPARHLPARQGARGARDLAQEPRPERPRRRGAEASVMTSATNGNGSGDAPRLVVVHVRDAINPTLAGRDGRRVPEPAAAARRRSTLVRLLLGRDDAAA